MKNCSRSEIPNLPRRIFIRRSCILWTITANRPNWRRSLDEKFGDFVASQVLSLYVAGLPEKDPKVRKAIEEYGESVLSYNLISAYCRDALADVDPDTLSAMYDRNPGKYMWKQRVRFDAVKCDDFESARKARELMSAGKTYQEVLAELNRGIVQVAEGQQITEFPENAFKPDFEVKKAFPM